MIIPQKYTLNTFGTDAATINNILGELEHSEILTSSGEVIFEYNMNEYGETLTQTISVGNYDLDTQVSITGISVNSGLVTFSVASHSFNIGDKISLVGINPSNFNLKDVEITAVTSTSFTISSTQTGSYINGGTASKRIDYYPVTGVKGLPFKKLFPIDTIIKPNRPIKSGIKYAIVGDLKGSSWNYGDPKSILYQTYSRVYYPGEDTIYKYWVGGRGKGIDVRLSYPKTILTNKITIKFELGHSYPATWAVYLSNQNTPIITGTATDITSTSGELNLYYNSDSAQWQKEETYSKSSPIQTTEVRVTATKETGSTDKFIGIIEISPRWETKITQEITAISVSRDTSSGSEDYLPVGRISANSATVSLFTGPSVLSFVDYDKSMSISSSVYYLSKNMIIRPNIYVKSKGYGQNMLARQGTFYLDNWTISEHGQIELYALDGAKILQETVSAPLLCEKYTSPGIVRTLLDSIGFTNYNINLRRKSAGVVNTFGGNVEDDSFITPSFWYTSNDKSVWESLSEICRDSQMTAFFDHDNILQIYTREALFDAARIGLLGNSTPVIWKFRNGIETPTTATITNAEIEVIPTDPSKIYLVYTTSTPHPFKVGDVVSMTNIIPTTYNKQNSLIVAADQNKFKILTQPYTMNGPTLWGGATNPVPTASKLPGLPNIISLNKNTQKATNKIKVIYNTAYTSSFEESQVDQPLWEETGVKYIGAGALRKTLLSSQTTGFIELNPVLTNTSQTTEELRQTEVPFYGYSGYMCIGSEIIEFDGAEFKYINESTGTETLVVLRSQSERQQIFSVASSKPKSILATGRFNIKERGAFDTQIQNHYAEPYEILSSWNVINEDGDVRVDSFLNLSLIPGSQQDQMVTRKTITPWSIWNLDSYKNSIESQTDYSGAIELNEKVNPGSTIEIDSKRVSNSVFTIYNRNANLNLRKLVLKQTNFDLDYYLNSQNYGPKTNYDYFAFGTKMFFAPWKTKTDAPAGGIAFFCNALGTSGYGILIKSTQKNSNDVDKEKKTDVRIVKFDGANSMKILSDDQSDLSKSVSNFGSSEEMYIDVKVDLSNANLTKFYVYINKRLIVATDPDPIPPTKYLGMFSTNGTCNFDFIYGYPLLKDEFDKMEGNNFIYGKTPIQSISTIYGQKLSNINSENRNFFYEEFGPVAKELIYLNSKYSQEAGFATYLSAGINPFVKVMSYKANNFGFKGYVINNASSPILISDKQSARLLMIGKSIVKGQQREYDAVTTIQNFMNPDPIIFDSTWIQTEDDARMLANWLAQQWSKNNINVRMKVFGNPFITIGDIISISYPLAGIESSKKFLVTSVEQVYDGGIETSIACRSITDLVKGQQII